MNGIRILATVLAVGFLGTTGALGQTNLLDAAKGLLGNVQEAKPGSGVGSLTNDEIAGGLREALRVGTERVVGQVGAVNGFNGDPEIHIPLPATLAKVQSALSMAGLSGLADDLELKLNRAAEAASPKAKEIFWQAITELTLEDVKGIYDGPKDAATKYFQKKTSRPLAESMQPVVDESLAEVGAVKAYDTMMGEYKSLPFVPDVKADLTTYVLEKALDGLFFYLAREEAAIRTNPAKRTTEILQRVFGDRV